MSDQPARSLTSKALRLLVVDDNDDNRNLLSRRLRGKGYEVDLAEDGPSALAACGKNEYDGIVLDMMMPGMSGIEVLEKVRQKHAKTELAVIMATAKSDSGSVVDALKRGANDYVTKPIDFPVLLARLETHLTMKAEAAERAASPNVDLIFGIARGTVLSNRYEILEKLGEGGFAVVYRARQLSTNREVALKHLKPIVLGCSGDGAAVERFERESKLIGELNHPHVVRLIDSGRVVVRAPNPRESENNLPTRNESKPRLDDSDRERAEGESGTDAPAEGRSGIENRAGAAPSEPGLPTSEPLSVPYIVMDLLEGEPLAGLIEREAPLDATRAVDLILPVLSALSAAHERGVIHRDIKPSNIIVTSDGLGTLEPKVLDFGIAKLMSHTKQDLTQSASLLGTPQYMAPEQARTMRDLDGRVDQYSAASVLYQMLTGAPLYSGVGLLEIIMQVMAGEYVRLPVARPELPTELGDVLDRALAIDRQNRYRSVRDFGHALLPFASARAVGRWSEYFTASPPTTEDAPAESGPSSNPIRWAEPASAEISIVRSEPADARAPGSTLRSPDVPRRSSDPDLAVAPTALVPLPKSSASSASSVTGDTTRSSVRDLEAAESSSPKAAASAPEEEEAPKRSEAPKPKAAPPAPLAKAEPKMPWERTALIAIAIAAVVYALARYVL